MQFQFNAIPIQCNSNSGSMQFQCNFNSMQFNAIPMQVKAIQCYSMQLTATTHRPLQTCSQTKYTGAVMQRRGRNFASSRRTDSCFEQDITHTPEPRPAKSIGRVLPSTAQCCPVPSHPCPAPSQPCSVPSHPCPVLPSAIQYCPGQGGPCCHLPPICQQRRCTHFHRHPPRLRGRCHCGP